MSPDDPDDFLVDRLRWIIGLRWTALGGMVVAAGLAYSGLHPGVAWELLLATVIGSLTLENRAEGGARATLVLPGADVDVVAIGEREAAQ